MRRLALRLLLVVGLLLPGAVLGWSPAAAQDAPGGSPMTLPGEGEFANLKVTVSQTRDLINQVIRISWTGGVPTGTGQALNNYLQVMQCWGDPSAGPKRTQCQFGGFRSVGEFTQAQFVQSRRVYSRGTGPEQPGYADPNEKLLPFNDPATPFEDPSHVPFWAAGEPVEPTQAAINDNSDFFDSLLTNEVPIARTSNNNTGELLFEVQTVRQAAGLGCGQVLTAADQTVTARPCWLVVVPRGATEVDGSTGPLNSSPLSESNWAKRIQFPLTFLPVGQACPFGAAERPVLGHELAVDAVSRWQPVLCAGGGTAFSFTQLSDDLARQQLLEATRPSLAVVTDPVPPDQQLQPLVYAPIALSGLTIAFNIERQPVDPNDVENGQPFTAMKLTPRLVAKLLSQSYYEAIEGVPDVRKHLEGNPRGLSSDPEFLALNPEYEGRDSVRRPADAIVQLGTSDSTAWLWTWVVADPAARTWLEGTPDEAGMRVNPANQIDPARGLVLPVPRFPRNDQSCFVGRIAEIRTCTSDTRPFANDMHEAGRAASRADTLGREAVDPPIGPGVPKYGRVARQPAGQRSVLAVVDSATAARYGLRTAALRNAAGQFVRPEGPGLLAAAAAMKPSGVDGVVAPDVSAADPAAYPLTMLSYAAAAPAALDKPAGADFAAFLNYAVGDGQTPGVAPGQLPAGYAPLPEPLRAQTRAAATRIQAEAGTAPAGDPDGTGGAEGGPSAPDQPLSPAAAAGIAAIPGIGALAPTAPAAIGPAAQPAGPPAVVAEPVADVRRTPALPAPAVGALLVALLIGGGLAAALAPATHLLGNQRTATGGDDTDRTPARRLLSWPMARPALLARRR